MKKFFSFKSYLIITVIYIILMFVGYKFDLVISDALYNGASSFGKLMAQYGALPSVLVAAIGGTMILLGDNNKKKLYTGIRVFFCFGCIAFAFSYTIIEGLSNKASILGIVAQEVIIVIAILVTFFLARKKNKEALTRVGLWLMFMVASEVVVINFALKYIFPRPRYRFIIASGKDLFRPVFSADRELKAAYVAKGILSEEFKSFPSGHAASGACLLGVSGLCYLNDSLKNKSAIFIILAFVGMVLMSLGRLVYGAHFLTDVLTGMFITITTSMFFHMLFIRTYRK